MVGVMVSAVSPGCFQARIARVGRHVDRGEWASGHWLLAGLRQCSLRHGCPDGAACSAAAELLLGDLRGLVRDQAVAAPPHP